MPGVFRQSVELAAETAREAADAGVPAVLLFGIPETKDAVGSEATSADGVVQRAVAAIKEARPSLLVATDV